MEMFSKTPLSLSATVGGKTAKVQPKRILKARSAGPKSKLSSRSVHSEPNASENKDRLDAVNQLKSKPSSGTLKRKQLGARDVNILKATSATTSDLKRVLGCSPPDQARASSVQENQDKPISSPSITHSSCKLNIIPFGEIASNLTRGLHVNEIFPNPSSYLETTKSEIKKIMKQRNPEVYEQLKSSFCSSLEGAINLLTNLLECTDEKNELFSIQGQRFSPDPLALLFPTVTESVGVNSSPCITTSQVNTTGSDYFTPEYKPADFIHITTPKYKPTDFIDLMDNDSVTTTFSEPVVMETGSRWDTSPVERPKMFPHQLY